MTRFGMVEALRHRAPGTTHEDILGEALKEAGVSLEFVRSYEWREHILGDGLVVYLLLNPAPDWDLVTVFIPKARFLEL